MDDATGKADNSKYGAAGLRNRLAIQKKLLPGRLQPGEARGRQWS